MDIVCNVCGNEFEAARSDARFCSPKCRVQNHRREHGAVSEPRKRRPLPDAFRETTYDLERKAQRLQRLALDDRMPRNRERIAQGQLGGLLRVRATLDAVIRSLGEAPPTLGEYFENAGEEAETLAMAEMGDAAFEMALALSKAEGDLSARNVLSNAPRTD